MVRIAQRDGQRAVTAHGMAEQAAPAHIGRQIGADDRRQFLDDIVVHPVVRGPWFGGGVDVEAGAGA